MSLNQVIENCPVTGIQVRTDDLGLKKVKAVETPHGTIETPCVVNCAGEGFTVQCVVLTRSWLSVEQTIPSCKSVTSEEDLFDLVLSVLIGIIRPLLTHFQRDKMS